MYTLTIVLLKIINDFSGDNLTKTFLRRLRYQPLSDLFLYHFFIIGKTRFKVRNQIYTGSDSYDSGRRLGPG